MSTTQRVVRKQLAGAEDILQGVGTVTQTRGSGSYPIHKLDIPIPTYDIAEMQASSAEFMRLYGTDTAYTDYRRNPEGTIGIPSNLGGVWEPLRSSEYLVCGNFAVGAYVFNSDCIVALDQQSYNWQGDVPKVVAAGSTPATSGGIGAGAWVDRTDVTLRAELAGGNGVDLVGGAKRIELTRDISSVAFNPITESTYDANIASIDSNSSMRLKLSITGSDTAGTPAAGYTNAIDLTADYSCIINESGHNESLSSNEGRTGIMAKRVKLVHGGQGDLIAYNASIRVNGASKEGVTHWLSNPAGVLINGTIIGETDGCYLNPRELYLTDKPNEIAYNVACVGDVINMDRNHISESKINGGIGQIWAAYRAQSVGSARVDSILSATGLFFRGVDLSMPALDFESKAAITIKANDRIYLNATAAEVDDATVFIRSNWRSTDVGETYIEYDTNTLRAKIVVGGVESLQVSNAQVSVTRLSTSEDVIIAATKSVYIGSSKILGGRVVGWTRMTGVEDKSSSFDVSNITVSQLASRVKAIESALHLSGGINGLLGD